MDEVNRDGKYLSKQIRKAVKFLNVFSKSMNKEETTALKAAEDRNKIENNGLKDNYHEIKLYVTKMDDIR